MTQTRSELIAKIRAQRRAKNEGDKKGLSKMRKAELLDLLEFETSGDNPEPRKDNVVEPNDEHKEKHKEKQKPKPKKKKVVEVVEEVEEVSSSSDTENDSSDGKVEEVEEVKELFVQNDDEEPFLYTAREAKKEIKKKAMGFKRLMKEYIVDVKNATTDSIIEQYIADHNYYKDLFKYEIEDILDESPELPEKFLSEIDNIFSTATDNFSLALQ